MSITLTTNHQLIKPDQAESIKQALPSYEGWASQNGKNQDRIDAAFRKDTGSYTVAWTASTTNPTLGSGGVTEGKYVRLFPRLVIVYFRIFMGTTGFNPGSGQYRINTPNYPFDPVIANFSELLPIGRAIFTNANDTPSCSVFSVNYRATDGLIIMRPSTGDIWSSTVPIALEASDRVCGYFIYPTAAA